MFLAFSHQVGSSSRFWPEHCKPIISGTVIWKLLVKAGGWGGEGVGCEGWKRLFELIIEKKIYGGTRRPDTIPELQAWPMSSSHCGGVTELGPTFHGPEFWWPLSFLTPYQKALIVWHTVGWGEHWCQTCWSLLPLSRGLKGSQTGPCQGLMSAEWVSLQHVTTLCHIPWPLKDLCTEWFRVWATCLSEGT